MNKTQKRILAAMALVLVLTLAIVAYSIAVLQRVDKSVSDYQVTLNAMSVNVTQTTLSQLH